MTMDARKSAIFEFQFNVTMVKPILQTTTQLIQ